MTDDPSTTPKIDGFDVLSKLDILKGIRRDSEKNPDDDINYHATASFFRIRAFEYKRSEIVDCYTNDTCFYDGDLPRNFASAFLYDGTKNLGLGVDWVARSSITDYDMVWPGKQLLAGDATSFRMKMFARSYDDPDGKNEPYLFEGENAYRPLGTLCCSELPLLNAIHAIGNGLGFISAEGVFNDNAVFVVMTERIPCYSCRENIVKFIKQNGGYRLKVFYMFDCGAQDYYEDSSTLSSFFHERGVDAEIIRVKFIPGADRDFYEDTPHKIRFSKPFTGYERPDENVYASLDIRTMTHGQPDSWNVQLRFDPGATDAYLVLLDPDADDAAQAVAFFENEFFSNHKFDLFDAKDRRRKKR